MKVNQLLFKNEQGSALVMVLMLSMVFAILGTSLLYVAFQHHENELKDELRLQAYYAAEAGAMNGIEQIRNSTNRIITDTGDTLASSPTVSYTISNVTKSGTEYLFESTGVAELNNQLKAQTKITVKLDKNKPVEFQTIPFFDYSLFSQKDLYLGQERVTFNNWSASWENPFMRLSVYDKEDAVLKNKIDSVGNIYSDSGIHLYYTDQVRDRKTCSIFNPFCWMSTFFDTFFTSYTSPDSYYVSGYAKQVLGVKPILKDGVLRSPKAYKSGYNLFEDEGSFFNFSGSTVNDYIVDEYTREQRDPSANALTNDILASYGSNLRLQNNDIGSFDVIFSNLTTEITNLSHTYNMREHLGDLHITNDDVSKSQLQGWIHVTGNLIIDEGVKIDNLRDLLVLVDGGIIIGAKPPAAFEGADLPVELKGQNILLISKGTPTIPTAWGNMVKGISPIRNLIGDSYDYWLFGNITTYLTQSYMNKYIDNPEQLSIVVNQNSEIDGWLIGKKMSPWIIR